MKTLVTGSRTLTSQHYEELKRAIEALPNRPTLTLHGGARGADELAARWAAENGVPTLVIKPDYQNNPPKWAPLKRNQELVRNADQTLACYHQRETNGTKFTADCTLKHGKPLHVITINAA